MRVLFDARKLGDGGIGVYSENLIRGLASHSDVEISLIVRPQIQSRAEYSWLSEFNLIEDSSTSYSLDELFSFSKRLSFGDFDIYHSPHFTLPMGIPIPTVITVHDLIQVNHPEKGYYPYVASPLIRFSMERATRVLTVSNATSDDLDKFALRKKALREKLRVVPNAIDPIYLSESQSFDQLAQKFNIQRPYLFSVFSNLKPHKGVPDLLAAFSQAKEEIAGRISTEKEFQSLGGLRLVLAGKGTEEIVELERLLEQVGAIGEVHVLGSVSKEDLRGLYRYARAVVSPTTAEGFGLPVLEARSVGTPVIARPVPSVVELLTDRDTQCADYSVESLREGILAALFKPAPTTESRQSLTKCIERFRREDIAKQVLEVYQEAVGVGVSGSVH